MVQESKYGTVPWQACIRGGYRILEGGVGGGGTGGGGGGVVGRGCSR